MRCIVRKILLPEDHSVENHFAKLRNRKPNYQPILVDQTVEEILSLDVMANCLRERGCQLEETLDGIRISSKQLVFGYRTIVELFAIS